MGYEILTCSQILHEQDSQLEILTGSVTPNERSSITNGIGCTNAYLLMLKVTIFY